MPRLSKCPACEKPASEKHKPFCSRKCKDVDLINWLSGSYAVPAVELDDIDDEEIDSDDGLKNSDH